MKKITEALGCVEKVPCKKWLNGNCDCPSVLARALRSALKDTERLDRLEQAIMEQGDDEAISYDSSWAAKNERWNVLGDEDWHPTLRRAIDAALRAAGVGEKGK